MMICGMEGHVAGHHRPWPVQSLQLYQDINQILVVVINRNAYHPYIYVILISFKILYSHMCIIMQSQPHKSKYPAEVLEFCIN